MITGIYQCRYSSINDEKHFPVLASALSRMRGQEVAASYTLIVLARFRRANCETMPPKLEIFD